jgi:hypothetical protein
MLTILLTLLCVRLVWLSKNGKILIPKDKKQFKELIRFLDGGYVTAPLTKRRHLTNSKQYL